MTHLAIVFPGQRYGHEAPLLWYARHALQEVGASVVSVTYDDTTDERRFFAGVRRDVTAALESHRPDRVTFVAKSLGTHALAEVARAGLAPDASAVWLTPVWSDDSLRAAITDDTAIVSVMHANNEIGTVQPVAELAAIAHERRALFHTDAVQSAGKVPIDVKGLSADLLTISAHKFYGPKGVGALWIRRGVRLQPPLTGGKQERSRRAGTENVPGIAGMGVAAREAIAKMDAEATRLAALRDRLEDGILRSVSGTVLNGVRSPRVPNTTNISFDRTEAESLLIALDLEGIAVSTGSACSSGTLEPSHVLKAMGFPPHRTQNSLRFSLGMANTDADIERVIAVLPGIVEKLCSLTRVGARS